MSVGQSVDSSSIYELGPSQTLEVPGPKTLFNKKAQPIDIELPVMVISGKFARLFRVPLAILFLCAWIGSVIYATHYLSDGDNAGGLQTFRAGNLIFISVVTIPLLPSLYYNLMVDTLAGKYSLLLGSEAFLDTRILAEPIKWRDVEGIKVVKNGGYVQGISLKLSTPCVFNQRYLKKFKQTMWNGYKDSSNVYINIAKIKYRKNIIINIFLSKARTGSVSEI